jgi:hypothetical protein
MSNPNPLNPRNLLELADELERKRGPVLVERWRVTAAAGTPEPAWRMRRQIREAFRDEWRRRLEPTTGAGRQGAGRAQMKAVVSAFRQLDRDLEAALLAADPAAMPKLAADAIRRRVKR